MKVVCEQFKNIKMILKEPIGFKSVFKGAINGSIRMTKYKCIDEDQNTNYGTPNKTYKNILVLAKENGVSKWDIGLGCACIGENEEVIEYIIKKGITDWNNGLFGACQTNNVKMVNMMIDKGATKLLEGFKVACFFGQLDVVQLFFSMGVCDINIGMSFAQRGKECLPGCEKKYDALIEFLVQLGTLLNNNFM
jgi:hypothetical protein